MWTDDPINNMKAGL